MIQCQTCGQANSTESNFCRFCGARFTQQEGESNFDFAPPRPYVWKTDEFQTAKPQPRKTKQINQVQPLVNQTGLENEPFQTRQLAYQQPAQIIAGGYRCPRCASQLLPRIEKRISSAGWIVFTVLLITFFPLFWIGFLVKEDVKVCPVCNYKTSF
jgi:RNA polymerase subunit RPABC4/transcription elongation factor Spt4